MDIVVSLLGKQGVILAIGAIIFLFVYKYSVGIFDWVENQTIGTRSYILEKLDLLMIDIKPEYITYALLFMSLGTGGLIFITIGFLGSWVTGVFIGLLVSFLGFKIPKPIINKFVEGRRKKYQSQMVDGLTLLSNGIRAGLSLPQSLAMVVDEMPAPISEEFNLVLQQNRIGVPLEECFEGLCKRVPTQDNEMFVSSINILRETGGNLSEVFDTIVGVIRERMRLQQKVETLTAAGLFQGYTIAAMPFAIGGIFASSDPEGMKRMVTHPVGIAMLVAALLLDALGLFIIMKIVKIET